jgi:O-antigen/teichoic acid export membrane protein
MAGGTAIAQAIGMLAAPILTRIYTPEDFGIRAVFVALLAITVIVAAFRYPMAIPLPEEDEQAVNLLALSFGLLAAGAGVVGLAVWLAGDLLIMSANAPDLRPFLWLVPLGLLGAGAYQALTYWAVRKKAFGTIARTTVVQSAGGTGVSIGLGFLAAGPLGLIVGTLVGQAGGVTTLGRVVKNTGWEAFRSVSASGVKAAAYRYRQFPLFSTWAGLLNTLSLQVPVLILSGSFGSQVVGLYALADRILKLPLQYVGNAVGKPFFGRAAQAKREGNLASITMKLFSTLSAMGLPALVILALVAPAAFTAVFGEAWRTAGVYVQWLSPLFVFILVGSPISTLVAVHESQFGGLVFQVGLLVGRVAALLLGGMWAGPVGAIGAYGVVSALFWLIFIGWIMHLTGIGLMAWGSVLLRNLLIGFVLGLPIILAFVLQAPASVAVAAGLAGGLGAAGVAAHALRRTRHRDAYCGDSLV